MNDPTAIHPEDVLPVRSRISWGAIFAGAFTSLSALVLLTMLGTALGLTWGEHTDRGDYVATGAAIWTAFSGLIALFLGGVVTSMFTAGESRAEAVLYGVVLWGVLFVSVAAISVAGTRLALGGVLETANAVTNAAGSDWERVATTPAFLRIRSTRCGLRCPPSAFWIRPWFMTAPPVPPGGRWWG